MGLGKFLKAKMLTYIKEKFPEVKSINTDFSVTITPKYFILEIDYNTSKDSAILTDTIEVPFDKEWNLVQNHYEELYYYKDCFYFLYRCTRYELQCCVEKKRYYRQLA